MLNKLYLIAILCIFLGTDIKAQSSKKEQKMQKKIAQFEQSKALIASKNYLFTGKFALPQKGRQVDLSARANFMKIMGDKGNAQMPYFGVAYSGGFGADGGIVFDAELEEYKVIQNDKKYRITITFRVKGKGETYDCTLMVGSIENASLSVMSSRRGGIRYTGYLKSIENDE